MRNPQGYSVIVDPEAKAPIERDSITCAHCNGVVFVKPGSGITVYITADGKEEPGAFCRQCMRAICLHCHDMGVCRPFMRWVEEQEKKHRRRPHV